MHDRARSSFLVPFLLSCFPTVVVKTCFFWSCEFSNTACGTQSIWALGVCILCSGRQMSGQMRQLCHLEGFLIKQWFLLLELLERFFFQKCLKISSFVWMQMGTWIVIKAFWELHLPFMVVWAWPMSIMGDQFTTSLKYESQAYLLVTLPLTGFLVSEMIQMLLRESGSTLTFNNERQWNYFCQVW